MIDDMKVECVKAMLIPMLRTIDFINVKVLNNSKLIKNDKFIKCLTILSDLKIIGIHNKVRPTFGLMVALRVPTVLNSMLYVHAMEYIQQSYHMMVLRD